MLQYRLEISPCPLSRKNLLTPEEYPVRERLADFRSEFFRGEMFAMAGASYDRGIKFGHYRQLQSVQEYVLVAQDRPLVERYVRQSDDSWLLTAFSNMSQTFEFGTIIAQVPLADVYRGVTLPEKPER